MKKWFGKVKKYVIEHAESIAISLCVAVWGAICFWVGLKSGIKTGINAVFKGLDELGEWS